MEKASRFPETPGTWQALASSQVETLEITEGIGESGRFMVKAADCLMIDPRIDKIAYDCFLTHIQQERTSRRIGII